MGGKRGHSSPKFNTKCREKIQEDVEGNSLLYFQGLNSGVISTPDETKSQIQVTNENAKCLLPERNILSKFKNEKANACCQN